MTPTRLPHCTALAAACLAAALAPLAHAVTPTELADCNDVTGRECSAAEKADILSWLLTLKR